MRRVARASPPPRRRPGGHDQKAGSVRRERSKTLIGASIALAFFVVFFLVPPLNMLITSVRSSAGIAARRATPPMPAAGCGSASAPSP